MFTEMIRGEDGANDSRTGTQRGGTGTRGIQGRADERGMEHGRVVSISGNSQCASEGPRGGAQAITNTTKRNRTRNKDRTASVVDGTAPATGQHQGHVLASARQKHKNKLPRVRSAAPVEDIGTIKERRRSVLHPEWAIVLGGGVDVWLEVLAWEQLYGKQWDGVIVVANDVGCHWPREFDYWCTLHPERMPPWQAVRTANDFPDGYATVGRRKHALDMLVRPWAGGSSGMLAVQTAQVVGCVRVIMCGVPMTATPHFVESKMHRRDTKWQACAGHWRAWKQQEAKMQGWVRSMSGRTAELLGVPTVEWLNNEEDADAE